MVSAYVPEDYEKKSTPVSNFVLHTVTSQLGYSQWSLNNNGIYPSLAGVEYNMSMICLKVVQDMFLFLFCIFSHFTPEKIELSPLSAVLLSANLPHDTSQLSNVRSIYSDCAPGNQVSLPQNNKHGQYVAQGLRKVYCYQTIS